MPAAFSLESRFALFSASQSVSIDLLTSFFFYQTLFRRLLASMIEFPRALVLETSLLTSLLLASSSLIAEIF